MASRDIINSQRMAICMDEPLEAQRMAGFIALQMSKMWGMFEGGEKRTMPLLKGPSLAHTTTILGSAPTSLRLIKKGSFCHQRC